VGDGDDMHQGFGNHYSAISEATGWFQQQADRRAINLTSRTRRLMHADEGLGRKLCVPSDSVARGTIVLAVSSKLINTEGR